MRSVPGARTARDRESVRRPIAELKHTTTKKLVLVFFAKSRRKPEHQLYAFHFTYPIAKSGVEFFFLRRDDAGRAKRAQPAEGHGAITVDRAITGSGAPLIIFRQEHNNWNTTPSVDAQFWGQFSVLWSLDKAQIDLAGIDLDDPLNQRALFNAIAAPDAAEDQNFHFPHEATDKLFLGIGQSGGIICLSPTTLLFVGARPNVPVVKEPRGKLIRKVGSCDHGR